MSENKKNIPIVPVVISTISLIVGFTIGIFYQKSKTPSFSANRQFQNAGNGEGRGLGMGNNSDSTGTQKNRGQMAGFRQTAGEIIKVDDKSITIKMTDGSSKIVLISDTTVVNQSVTASKADLKVGTKVAVMGDQNTDGSVVGKNIELNPRFAIITPTQNQ